MSTDPHNPGGNGPGGPDDGDGRDEVNGRHPGVTAGSAPLADDPGQGIGMPEVDRRGPLVVCPPFRPDTVSLGPFDAEPFELQPITWTLPTGDVRPGEDLVRCNAEWLAGALAAAGVELGAFDRLQVHLIATDGWGPVQAVAGWITRAARHGHDQATPLTHPPDEPGESRASP